MCSPFERGTARTVSYTHLDVYKRQAQGYEVGKSLCDDSKLDYCKEMMAKAQEKGVKLLLPVDACLLYTSIVFSMIAVSCLFSFRWASS